MALSWDAIFRSRRGALLADGGGLRLNISEKTLGGSSVNSELLERNTAHFELLSTRQTARNTHRSWRNRRTS